MDKDDYLLRLSGNVFAKCVNSIQGSERLTLRKDLAVAFRLKILEQLVIYWELNKEVVNLSTQSGGSLGCED